MNQKKEKAMEEDEISEELAALQFNILDSYFQFRSNLPSSEMTGTKMIEENKSTEDIQEDLSAMVNINKATINLYMTSHDYGVKTMPDGTVKWAIWRDASTLL